VTAPRRPPEWHIRCRPVPGLPPIGRSPDVQLGTMATEGSRTDLPVCLQLRLARGDGVSRRRRGENRCCRRLTAGESAGRGREDALVRASAVSGAWNRAAFDEGSGCTTSRRRTCQRRAKALRRIAQGSTPHRVRPLGHDVREITNDKGQAVRVLCRSARRAVHWKWRMSRRLDGFNLVALRSGVAVCSRLPPAARHSFRPAVGSGPKQVMSVRRDRHRHPRSWMQEKQGVQQDLAGELRHGQPRSRRRSYGGCGRCCPPWRVDRAGFIGGVPRLRASQFGVYRGLC